MTDQRRRIRETVAANPGIHFSALGRELDLATGQVQYHLKRLRRADRLVSEERGGRTHYFTPDVPAGDRAAIAALRRETARAIVEHLIGAGAARPASVADALGIARSTLEWHCDRLVACDLVRKERDERGRVTLVLADPERVASALRAVDPTLPERLVDRFTRLVDGLLEAE